MNLMQTVKNFDSKKIFNFDIVEPCVTVEHLICGELAIPQFPLVVIKRFETENIECLTDDNTNKACKSFVALTPWNTVIAKAYERNHDTLLEIFCPFTEEFLATVTTKNLQSYEVNFAITDKTMVFRNIDRRNTENSAAISMLRFALGRMNTFYNGSIGKIPFTAKYISDRNTLLELANSIEFKGDVLASTNHSMFKIESGSREFYVQIYPAVMHDIGRDHIMFVEKFCGEVKNYSYTAYRSGNHNNKPTTVMLNGNFKAYIVNPAFDMQTVSIFETFINSIRETRFTLTEMHLELDCKIEKSYHIINDDDMRIVEKRFSFNGVSGVNRYSTNYQCLESNININHNNTNIKYKRDHLRLPCIEIKNSNIEYVQKKISGKKAEFRLSTRDLEAVMYAFIYGNFAETVDFGFCIEDGEEDGHIQICSVIKLPKGCKLRNNTVENLFEHLQEQIVEMQSTPILRLNSSNTVMVKFENISDCGYVTLVGLGEKGEKVIERIREDIGETYEGDFESFVQMLKLYTKLSA